MISLNIKLQKWTWQCSAYAPFILHILETPILKYNLLEEKSIPRRPSSNLVLFIVNWCFHSNDLCFETIEAVLTRRKQPTKLNMYVNASGKKFFGLYSCSLIFHALGCFSNSTWVNYFNWNDRFSRIVSQVIGLGHCMNNWFFLLYVCIS